MTPGWPRATFSPSAKTRLSEPDGAAGGDFVWPPPADDPASCSMVLIDVEAERSSRPTPIRLADEPMAPFPDIETALDEFADLPTMSQRPATARPAVPHVLQSTPRPASWWRAAGMRSVVALGIGASLALMPPPGLPPAKGARTLDVPATPAPRLVVPRGIGTPAARRVEPKPVVEPVAARTHQRDEDHIRITLAELRTAYAQLDADAARQVWPSVDVDALARAFDGLKSQELRFDACDVTVDGAHARAACTGEAVYVPRVGGAVSSTAARAWTFELTRTRERWMIASARAS